MHAHQLDAVFDLGECPLEVVGAKHVFITHGHDDHIRCLTRHMSLRGLLGHKPATYYVPAAIMSEVRDMCGIEIRLGNLHDMPNLFSVPSPGWFPRGLAESPVTVRSFPVDHRVHALGYTMHGKKSRLRPEWEGRLHADIAKARDAGENVTEEYEVQHLTFIGDHTATALALDHIWDSDALVVEVTFLDGSIEDARRKGHTHLDELVAELEKREPRPAGRREQTLVLKHFSMKYSPDEIRALVAAKLPAKWAPHTRILL